jgi:hypothetical protein
VHKLKLIGTTVTVMAACAGVASAASSPTVRTGPATSISQGTAVLNGTVDPNGRATTYHFQWGPTTAFTGSSATAKAGSGTKPTAVHATATGLAPGTTYYYRLDASNAAGTTIGATRLFKTAGNPPPTGTTGGTENVGRNSGTLTGIVYPENQATNWYFQWGLSSGYTYDTFGGTVAAGTAPVEVSSALTGLEPGTIFHYRLVVDHGPAAIAYGTDEFFETFPAPAPKPRIFVSTSPRRARTPATFLTSGRLRGPSSTPDSLQCTGNVRITILLGRRAVRSGLASVQPNCTFAATAHFAHLPGRGPRGRTVRLTVKARFLGNHFLARVSARNHTLTLR